MLNETAMCLIFILILILIIRNYNIKNYNYPYLVVNHIITYFYRAILMDWTLSSNHVLCPCHFSELTDVYFLFHLQFCDYIFLSSNIKQNWKTKHKVCKFSHDSFQPGDGEVETWHEDVQFYKIFNMQGMRVCRLSFLNINTMMLDF